MKKNLLNIVVWAYYKLLPSFIKKPLYKIFDYVLAGYRIKKAGIYSIKYKDKFILNDKKNKIKFILSSYISRNDLYALVGYFQRYMPKKGNIVIDGGAFHGLVSIYLAHLVGETGKVFAFEPDPVNYKILKENIELNNIKNIIAINKGLWSHEDVLSLSRTGIDSSVFIKDQHKGDTIQIHLVNPLDEIKKHGYNKIDFIKSDIEGAEIELIKGLENHMKDHNINFAIASYHKIPGENHQTYRTLESLFKNLGYYSETKRRGHLTTYAFRR